MNPRDFVIAMVVVALGWLWLLDAVLRAVN